jgi:cobalamin biosynthesis protein CobD/CbiB
MWKMEAGYYKDTCEYIVRSHSLEDARKKVLEIVRRDIHPEADIVIGSEVELKSCGNRDVWI